MKEEEDGASTANERLITLLCVVISEVASTPTRYGTQATSLTL